MKDSLKKILETYKQSHLLRFENCVSEAENAALEAELEKIDFPHLDTLIKEPEVQVKEEVELPAVDTNKAVDAEQFLHSLTDKGEKEQAKAVESAIAEEKKQAMAEADDKLNSLLKGQK